MARKLRIAVSVFFAVLTVALCVLWVRSYWQSDTVGMQCEAKVLYDVTSSQGFIHLTRLCNTTPDEPDWPYYVHVEFAELPDGWREPRSWDLSRDSDGNTWLSAPHWFWALVTASLGISTLTRISFSLRTLLIATTLVAVLLGLEVWLAS
jgi:hypothetical protein